MEASRFRNTVPPSWLCDTTMCPAFPAASTFRKTAPGALASARNASSPVQAGQGESRGARAANECRALPGNSVGQLDGGVAGQRQECRHPGNAAYPAHGIARGDPVQDAQARACGGRVRGRAFPGAAAPLFRRETVPQPRHQLPREGVRAFDDGVGQGSGRFVGHLGWLRSCRCQDRAGEPPFPGIAELMSRTGRGKAPGGAGTGTASGVRHGHAVACRGVMVVARKEAVAATSMGQGRNGGRHGCARDR